MCQQYAEFHIIRTRNKIPGDKSHLAIQRKHCKFFITLTWQHPRSFKTIPLMFQIVVREANSNTLPQVTSTFPLLTHLFPTQINCSSQVRLQLCDKNLSQNMLQELKNELMHELIPHPLMKLDTMKNSQTRKFPVAVPRKQYC